MVWSLSGKLGLTCMGRRGQEHAFPTLLEPEPAWHLEAESGGLACLLCAVLISPYLLSTELTWQVVDIDTAL